MTATVLTNEKGRIIDAVRVVRYGTGHLLLGSADAEQEVLRWITKYTIADDVAVRSVTNASTLWMTVGPQASASARGLVEGNPDNASLFPDGTTPLERVYILEMGDTTRAMHERALRNGIPILTPMEWDTVRILNGFAAYGRELDQRFNPFDVGLDALVSRTKGCYVGQEVLARIETYHKNRKTLVGFIAPATSTLHIGSAVRKNGIDVGLITSLAGESFNDRMVGLAVVSGDASAPGTILEAGDGGEIVISGFPIRPQAGENSFTRETEHT